MSETIKLSATISAKPSAIYNALLDATKHTEITGSKAIIEPTVGSKFNIHKGYIKGVNLELVRNKRIVQSWITKEFPKGVLPSIVIMNFEAIETGTKLTITHLEIPDDQGKMYKDGWKEYYIVPLKKYFSK